jgi:[ribosomal protein S18]-alanine N-acetyltransferase
MNIRPCNDDDFSAIHTVQLKCLKAAQWRQEDYAQLAHDPLGMVLVAEMEDERPPRVAGFAAFHRVLDEAELRNMAVDPSQQRKGIARALLAAGIHTLKANGVARLFLEVRSSNQPAIALYSSADFRLTHTRRDYYRDPAEDALVMARDLAPSSGSSPVPR